MRGVTFATHRAVEEIPCPDDPPCNARHFKLVGGTIYCINGTSMDRDRFRRIVGWIARRQGAVGEALLSALADGWPA